MVPPPRHRQDARPPAGIPRRGEFERNWAGARQGRATTSEVTTAIRTSSAGPRSRRAVRGRLRRSVHSLLNRCWRGATGLASSVAATPRHLGSPHDHNARRDHLGPGADRGGGTSPRLAPRIRVTHTKGTVLTGTFTATPRARELTRAAHMRGGPVRVTVRFSDGDPNPQCPDAAQNDPRGMAVKFYLPDGSTTDVVCQSWPVFALGHTGGLPRPDRGSGRRAGGHRGVPRPPPGDRRGHREDRRGGRPAAQLGQHGVQLARRVPARQRRRGRAVRALAARAGSGRSEPACRRARRGRQRLPHERDLRPAARAPPPAGASWPPTTTRPPTPAGRGPRTGSGSSTWAWSR